MRIGIIANVRKQATPEAVTTLVNALSDRRIDVVLQERLYDLSDRLRDAGEFVPTEQIPTRCDAVFAFGGDGTMLSTGRLLAGSGVPLVGFNLGTLGFLAEFPVDSIEATLDEFLAGTCSIVERSLLEARVPDSPEKPPLTALNDVVIDKRETRLIVNLAVYVNGDYLGTYNADGLILATPTGSTAYALAVGGPVVVPSANVIVIAPIAPHMLTARPVVIPDTAELVIVPIPKGDGDESIHVIADGQNHHYLELPTKITVTRHRHTVSLVKRASRTYFDVLRAKLLWGRRPTLENERDVTRNGDDGSL